MTAAPLTRIAPLAVDRVGAALVLGSALVWSFGGAIARFLAVEDPWAVVAWRSFWGAAFLVGFLAMRDGPREALRLFAAMGWPGLAVGLCFAIASTSFVVALGLTSVANIVLIQAVVPMIAALMGWALFGERVANATWAAIAAVFVGVGVMVSGSLSGATSLAGDALALLIALSFSTAVVITRRHAGVRMTPACALGCLIAGATAAPLAGSLAVSATDFGLLFAFGALNLGLGMALFATGARRVPAAVGALIGTAEPVASPLWVWLVHGEAASSRTLAGGALVIAALAAHFLRELTRQRRLPAPGTGDA